MGVNSGAGAAVASGAGYQARVASYMLATAICRFESNLISDEPIETIGFETAECIDDINVRLSNGCLIYIQAKAKIDFSLTESGELTSVFKQFESQEHKASRDGDTFVLATSSRSSRKIIYELRAALDAFRISPELEFLRDQPKALTEIISELRRTIIMLQAIAGRPKDINIANRIIRKSRVIPLDVEAGAPLEPAITLLLKSHKFSAPIALWGKLISDCLEHAKARHTLTIREATLQYQKYCMSENDISPDASDDLLKIEFGSMNISVGKEVLLCQIPEGTPIFAPGIAIIELYRFDENCAERIQFTEDNVILAGNNKIPLLRRAATYAGLMRLLKSDLSLATNQKISFYEMNTDTDIEAGLCSEAHRERLRKAAQKKPHPFHCLHCGRPVSEKEPCLIEQEPLLDPVVGLCHTKCLLPSDRLIGKAEMDIFNDHPELVNFDVNAWFHAAQNGQMAIMNANSVVGRIPHLIWGGGKKNWQEGQYVVEISLQGGGREIVTQRNGVHRFLKADAENFVSSLNNSYEEARNCSNPWCYTDQSKGYGQRSLLLEQFGGKERIIPVEIARVRKYEERFAARYNRPGSWYAPLLYLRDIETGEPITIENKLSLITNPLKLRNFLDNWQEAKFRIPDYETISIITDSDFDEFMRWVDEYGWRVVIDLMLNPADGTMASGIPITPLSSFQAMSRNNIPK